MVSRLPQGKTVMYKRIGHLLIAGALLFVGCTALHTRPSAGNACTEWSLVARGTNLVPFYPNTYTEYWLRSFFRSTQSSSTAFRITGQFSDARFSAFQSYSASGGGALTDFEIVPDPGSVNPFRPGVDRYARNRSYTIWFVPFGSARAGEPNTIVIPQDTDFPNLLLRITKADKGKEEHGGVPLPVIETFDATTGEPVPCPSKVLSIGGWNPGGIPSLPPAEDQISFYYLLAGDEFGRNRSGVPLFARLRHASEGNIAVLRFKVPTFPNTYNNPSTVFTEKDEVRMAMICAHGLWSTLTSECLADDELRQDSAGFATVVVGPEDTSLKAAAQARGYDYLSWKHFLVPALFYRQILPHRAFKGSAARVPVYDAAAALEPQGAEHFMGDYAPTGRVCAAREFMKGSQCGLPKREKPRADTIPPANPNARQSTARGARPSGPRDQLPGMATVTAVTGQAR